MEDDMADAPKAGTSAAGQFDNLSQRNIETEKDLSDMLGIGKRMLGMPPFYHPFSDPAGRVYAQTFLSDILNVNFIPGKARFNKSIAGITNQEKANLGGLKTLFGVSQQSSGDSQDPVSSSIAQLLSGNFFSSVDPKLDEKHANHQARDFRYYAFEPDYVSYFNHVQLMITYLSAQMGFGVQYSLKSAALSKVFTAQGLGIKFWVDKNGTSISESVSNQHGDSMLGGAAKGAAGIIREAQFLFGVNDTDALMAAQGNEESAQKIRNDMSKQASSQIDSALNGGIVSQLLSAGGAGKIHNVINGFNILYPEIWKESSFAPSYSIQIRLFSPYGDPKAIFKNVYIPFICLLCMALPKQVSLSGYGAPFIMKMDCPGWFSSDMCVITDMHWTKSGGESDNWSSGGLPTAIDIELTVKDLYPVMMQTDIFQFLVTNVGMATFLQTMAGVKMYKPNVFSDATAALIGNQLVQSAMGIGDRFGIISTNLKGALIRLGSETLAGGRFLFR
jgi:hypothetical protein